MYNAIDGVGRGGSYLYENDGVMMTRDPKPRLMWTAELHQQFVDAVTKLGGLDSQDSLLFLFLFVLINVWPSFSTF